MRWILLGIAVCGFLSLWGVAPGLAMLAAFVVMFVNFASFCLLYDRPTERARLRVAQRLEGMNPHTDTAQRLAAMQITPTTADRQLGLGPMTLLNLGTGIAAAAELIWGIVLRVS
jgi:hypothetical protein